MMPIEVSHQFALNGKRRPVVRNTHGEVGNVGEAGATRDCEQRGRARKRGSDTRAATIFLVGGPLGLT